MAINTTGFTQAKTIYVDFDQERKPSLRDIGSDQIGANGAKLISFGFGSESLAGYTVVLETKRVADGGLKYAIAETYTDNGSTRYKVALTEWFTTYRSALIMAVKVFNNNGVSIVDGEITEVDNDYLISVSDTFTLTVNYAPKATAVVPTFTASELELILATIAGKQDTANGIVVLQEEDALPDVSDGSKNGWTYLKKDDEGFFRVYQVNGSTLYPIDITVNRIRLDANYTQLPSDIGEMVWSQEHRTYLLKVTDEVYLEYGQELVFDSKASGPVNNGFPVFFVEPQGDHAISKQATADDVIANPYGLRGIATETVSNNEFFKTTQLGRVDGINTTNWATENGGSILYFDITESGTGAYNMTTIAPTKPNQVIKMGSIEKWSTGGANNGRIIVRIDYGESLGTLHDVDLSGVATGDILRKTNGTWTPTSDLTEAEADIVDLQGEIADIKSGTTIVKKAEQDKNGNDIVDTYAAKADTYTKTEVDNKIASVYKYKGSVDTFDDLPTIGLVVGDVYNVVDSGINYAWTGSEWDDIGGIEALATATNNGLMSKEDFSKLQALYTKAQLDTMFGAKVDKTTTVNSKALSGNITLNKTDIGLGNVDNTSDANKPVSTAQQTALDLKADKIVLTNLVTNGDLLIDSNADNIPDGFAYSNTTNMSLLNGIATFTATAQFGQFFSISSNAFLGNKLYCYAYYKVNSADVRLTFGQFVTASHPGNNTYKLVSLVNDMTVTDRFLQISDYKTSGWTPVEVDYMGVINLTAIFGKGNEPTKEFMDNIIRTKGYFTTALLNLNEIANPKADKVVLTNLIANGDFSNGTTGFSIIGAGGSVVGGVYQFTATAQLGRIQTSLTYETTDKVYIVAKVKASSSNVKLVDNASYTFKAHTGSGNYELLSLINTNKLSSKTWSVRDDNTTGFTQIDVDYMLAINLTAIFGAGNEPTKEQMDAIMTLKGGYFSTATLNVIDVMKLFAPKTQEAWLTPTLTTSTTTYLKYRKDTLGTVIVEGNLTVGTAGTNFTLPTGYRPLFTYVVGDLTFNTNGTVVSASTGLKYINVRFASV